MLLELYNEFYLAYVKYFDITSLVLNSLGKAVIFFIWTLIDSKMSVV